jgi:parallel beta-helix repeat protein
MILLFGCQFFFTLESQGADNIVYVDYRNSSGPWDGSKGFPFKELVDAYNLVEQNGTIFVYTGIYYSNLLIAKNISIIGIEKTDTILDGENSSYCIRILVSNVTISGFTIQNSEIGIDFDNISYCNISDNNIKNNLVGINIDSSSNNNTIFNNNFLGNSLHAYDLGTNYWDAGNIIGGNYWDNYIGTDKNKDGIGDNPYYLPDGDAVDQFPLINPFTLIPSAAFQYSPINPYSIDMIEFTDLSYDLDGGIESWYWDFGDGNNATLQHPNHTYYDNGAYNVTLTVNDIYGVTDHHVQLVNVLNVAPSPAFNYTPIVATDLDEINFSDISTDIDGEIVSWFWDFGDGNSSYKKYTTHTYADNGTYIVSLQVTDDDNAVKETTKTLTILNVAPIALFNYQPSNPTFNDTIQFFDVSNELDGVIEERLWDFGDGASSTERSPFHRYSNEGKYTVTLIVTDNDGASSSIKKDLMLVDPSPGEADPGVSILLYSIYLIFFILMIALVLYIKKKFG